MKNEWKKPSLEMLEVKLTMHRPGGKKYDDNWSENEDVPIDPETGLHMDTLS